MMASDWLAEVLHNLVTTSTFSLFLFMIVLSIKTPKRKKEKNVLFWKKATDQPWYFNEFLRYLYTSQLKIQANKGIKSLCTQHCLQFVSLAHEVVYRWRLASYVRIHVKLDSFLVFQKTLSLDHSKTNKKYLIFFLSWKNLSFAFPKFIVDIRCSSFLVNDSVTVWKCNKITKGTDSLITSPAITTKIYLQILSKNISAQDFPPLLCSL